MVEYPEQIEINITRVDILNGKRRDYNNCPIALSMKRNIKDKIIEVTSTYICIQDRLDEGNILEDCRYKLPYQAAKWIQAFDEGKTPRPITFLVKMDSKSSSVIVNKTKKQENINSYPSQFIMEVNEFLNTTMKTNKIEV
jgi:hypothetical protein